MSFEEGLLKQEVQFKLPELQILEVMSTGNGDINILHSKGIYRQFADQIIQGATFASIEFEQEVKPLRMVIADDKTLMLVC